MADRGDLETAWLRGLPGEDSGQAEAAA